MTQTLPPKPAKQPLDLQVNATRHSLLVEPRRSLLDALRHDCGLHGAKKVCDQGNCGACTVLLDGQAVYACLVLALECEGCRVDTVEGLSEGEVLHPLQRAFLDADALQCGYCTPGQLMSLKALFDLDPRPDDAAIVRALAGNLCRCGAYAHILDAARAAAGRGGQGSAH